MVLRQTQNENPVANFSLAVNQEWIDSDGNKQERVDWFQCVCWNRLAGVAENFLRKGSRVYIEGRMQIRSHEHPESGEERVVHEVVVCELRMLSPARRNAAQPNPAGRNRCPVPARFQLNVSIFDDRGGA